MIINLKEIALMASVGIYEHEKTAFTKVEISVQVVTSALEFNEENIVDYDTILKEVQDIAGAKHYGYIEELAFCIKGKIITLHPLIESVAVKVKKCIFEDLVEEISVEL